MPERRYWNPAIETMAWTGIAELQLERLRVHLGSLCERSPFYRRKLAEFDLSRLATLTELRRRITGALQILLDAPGPRVDPPLRLQVEHGAAEHDLAGLREMLERRLRERLVVSARVELTAPGTLPRFEMKSKLVRELYLEISA